MVAEVTQKSVQFDTTGLADCLLYPNNIFFYVKEVHQWRNEPTNLGGTIFARERSDQARGSVATERGSVPPPTIGSFFIFRLENVQSGAMPKKEIWLDDMYYMGKRVTIRPIGKVFFFFINSET